MFVEGGDPLDVPVESLTVIPAFDPEHREGEPLPCDFWLRERGAVRGPSSTPGQQVGIPRPIGEEQITSPSAPEPGRMPYQSLPRRLL